MYKVTVVTNQGQMRTYNFQSHEIGSWLSQNSYNVGASEVFLPNGNSGILLKIEAVEG